jgi:hypothetical protein
LSNLNKTASLPWASTASLVTFSKLFDDAKTGTSAPSMSIFTTTFPPAEVEDVVERDRVDMRHVVMTYRIANVIAVACFLSRRACRRFY